MTVLIDSEISGPNEVDQKALQEIAQQVLGICGHTESELSLLLVGDPRMQELNLQYRQKDKPTNVLSFPMQEGPEVVNGSMLGDVVISLDTAAREATEKEITLWQRTVRLLVHGIVHLLGYDHERSEQEATRMLAKEERIMELIIKKSVKF